MREARFAVLQRGWGPLRRGGAREGGGVSGVLGSGGSNSNWCRRGRARRQEADEQGPGVGPISFQANDLFTEEEDAFVVGGEDRGDQPGVGTVVGHDRRTVTANIYGEGGCGGVRPLAIVQGGAVSGSPCLW